MRRIEAILDANLVGQGRGAAIPNLQAAESLLSSGRCARVLSVCVEVCSAAFYLDDDPGVLISACLFGDGAGAAVLAQTAPGRRRIEWCGSVSLHNPQLRDLLRFEQRAGMLRNVLSPEVPRLAAEHSLRVLLFDADGDYAIGWTVFHGIVQQILKYLLQTHAVTNDHDWCARIAELEPMPCGCQAGIRHRLACQSSEI